MAKPGSKASSSADEAPEILAEWYAREKHARHAAEKLVEQKTEELLEANKALEQVVSGAVKLLTDVLAMTKPDVFQKAAKVQRWARRLKQNFDADKPWELDLAAILYPLGIIALPDIVAMKYALDAPLNEDEQAQIMESTLVAYQLVHNIPRMAGVARAIYYSRKGYDGSGYPKDNIKGEDLPQSSRVLKILIDLADAATGPSRTRTDAFKRLLANKAQYDADILALVHSSLIETPKTAEGKDSILTLKPSELRTGDILIGDIVDVNSRLLLAAGSELTDVSIQRLKIFFQNKVFRELVRVERQDIVSKAEKIANAKGAA